MVKPCGPFSASSISAAAIIVFALLPVMLALLLDARLAGPEVACELHSLGGIVKHHALRRDFRNGSPDQRAKQRLLLGRARTAVVAVIVDLIFREVGGLPIAERRRLVVP